MHISHDDVLLLIDALALLEQTSPPDSQRSAQCRLLAAEIAAEYDLNFITTSPN